MAGMQLGSQRHQKCNYMDQHNSSPRSTNFCLSRVLVDDSVVFVNVVMVRQAVIFVWLGVKILKLSRLKTINSFTSLMTKFVT